tara:strand:- start:128 stop:916 length:789 start_codon:yes stop_codon:yes gene_type:complete
MSGLTEREPTRKIGLYGYDSPPRYIASEKVTVPDGLGILDEFEYAKERTKLPIKVTAPGPLTLTIHIRPDQAYKSRLDLAWEFASVINSELKSLVKAGADYIQIDEPSFAIVPGELDDWISLYNATVEGVDAKLALHVCFGNLSSRARGKRTYKWMFPKLLEAKVDEFVLEYANREMSEKDLWSEFDIKQDLGAGVVDVKSFYLETPEDIAERVRSLLEHVPAEKLRINPDCGFFQLPRWITYLKLKNMVDGAKIVRRELGE